MEDKLAELASKVFFKEARAIRETEVFLAYYNRGCDLDSAFALKIGLAILMGKAIVLAVPHGLVVSPSLLRAADVVRYYEPGNQREMQDIINKDTELAKRKSQGTTLIKGGNL